MRALALLALTVTLGCADSRAVERVMEYVENDTTGVLGQNQRGVTCDTSFMPELESPQRMQMCERHIGDSLTYSYGALTGENSVRGENIRVDALRLKPYADSIRLALSKRFGSGTDCIQAPSTEPFTYYFRYWRRNDRTVFARATVIESSLFPSVLIEIAHGEKTCRQLVGFPHIN